MHSFSELTEENPTIEFNALIRATGIDNSLLKLDTEERE